jgi:hypothetical protein
MVSEAASLFRHGFQLALDPLLLVDQGPYARGETRFLRERPTLIGAESLPPFPMTAYAQNLYLRSRPGRWTPIILRSEHGNPTFRA